MNGKPAQRNKSLMYFGGVLKWGIGRAFLFVSAKTIDCRYLLKGRELGTAECHAQLEEAAAVRGDSAGPPGGFHALLIREDDPWPAGAGGGAVLHNLGSEANRLSRENLIPLSKNISDTQVDSWV